MKIEKFNEEIKKEVIDNFMVFLIDKYDDDLPNLSNYLIEAEKIELYLNFLAAIEEEDFNKIQDILNFLKSNIDKNTTLYLIPFRNERGTDFIKCTFVIYNEDGIELFMNTNKFNL